MPPDPPSLPCFYKARVSPPKLKILYETLTGVEQNVVANLGDTPRDPKTKLASLPDTYTNVPPIAKLRQVPPIPKSEGPNRANCQLIPQSMQEEYRYVHA